MFLRTNEVKKFLKEVRESKKVQQKIVCCNDCKYQERCIKNKVIGYVTYPTGEKGYAKTGITHYFDNACKFPIDKY